MIKHYLLTFLLLCSGILYAQEKNISHQFSTAGFYALHGTGREVLCMNPGWKFYKGDVVGADKVSFDDSKWNTVSLPNGIEYLPTEASGCINYQGIVWYRKHFKLPKELKQKELTLYFEAVMGKCKVYCNGKLVKEHFGGYLPVVVDVTSYLNTDQDNLIAVMADNSDDNTYPPGKQQDMLDYTYFGGIYRDCWLIANNKVYITDPNLEKIQAGGGLFVYYDNVSEKYADVGLKLHLRNRNPQAFSGEVTYRLIAPGKNKVKAKILKQHIHIPADSSSTITNVVKMKNPLLWSPDDPNLYTLEIYVKDKKGHIIDGYARRIGIRSFAFKGKDGFWLNGKPFGEPLIGANRHQDYAVLGNALTNNLHWRDAKKLRDAGLRVIRNAHAPQDPAFMDACDELGLLVIVNTPGWQYWNNAPIFAQRVYNDIRQMVRRDRNRPSVWLWEPILNETWYPDDFAKNATDLVHAEYPYASCNTVCDSEAKGSQYYRVQYSHPINGNTRHGLKKMQEGITYFTREWGDNVDNWSAHNSPSRTARNWGEVPMLIQAQHYAQPPYRYTCYNTLCQTPPQHVGGCLWHPFDHQRGYHPDPFYGGLMDVFRQPKFSYYMMMAQRPAKKMDRPYATGPVLFIAHEMTPFSPADVTVYSNCDEVRLTYNKGGKTYVYKKDSSKKGMPSPIITFKDVYHFMDDKHLTMDLRRPQDVFLAAEGLINGKVVVTDTVRPARRPTKIVLKMDNEGQVIRANGSDVVTVIAEVTDENGVVKRLNNEYIEFHIEGEGKLIGDAHILANPAPLKWGTAPILVQSTLHPGKVKLTASVLFKGSQQPVSAQLEWTTTPAQEYLLYDSRAYKDNSMTSHPSASKSINIQLEQQRQKLNAKKLKEVEQQQQDFGEKN